MKLDFKTIKENFLNQLKKDGTVEAYTKVSRFSIFDYADKFEEYLKDNYKEDELKDNASLFKNMSGVNVLNMAGNRTIIEKDKDEDNDFAVDFLNDLLKSDDFKDILDENNDGEIDNDEYCAYIQAISELDDDEDDISIDDLTTGAIGAKNGDLDIEVKRKEKPDTDKEEDEEEVKPEEEQTQSPEEETPTKGAGGGGGCGGADDEAEPVSEAGNVDSSMPQETTPSASASNLSEAQAVSGLENKSLDELKTMQDDCKNEMQSAVDDMKNVYEEQGQAVEEAKDAVDEKKDAYQEALKNATDEDNEIAQKISEYLDYISETEDKITETNENLAQVEADLSEAEMQQTEAQAKQDEAQAKYDGLESAYQQNQTNLESMQSQYSSMPDTITDADGNQIPNQAKIALAGQIEQLEAQQEQLKQQMEAAKQEIEAAQQEVEEAQEKIEGLEEEQQTQQDLLDQYEENLETQEKAKEELEEQLSEETQEAIKEAKEEYNQAQDNFKNTQKTFTDTLQTAKDNIQTTKNNYNDVSNAIAKRQKEDTKNSNISDIKYSSGKASDIINNSAFKDGVLAEMGDYIDEVCEKYDVDVNLVLAIMAGETGWGTSYAIREQNNPGGFMDPSTGWSQVQTFSSLEAGIEAVVKNLRTGYIDQGLTTVADIGNKYCPVGAANDPTGLNQNWIPSVVSTYSQFSGIDINKDTDLSQYW